MKIAFLHHKATHRVFPWHQILQQRPFPANFKEIGRPTY